MGRALHYTGRMKAAFSLVELSIVLVILGLLTGGILGGQALIRAAELRAVTTEYTRWTTAMQTFRDKYFAMPGDLTNATSFWTVAGGTGNDVACRTAALTSTTGTCNGNGNGVLDGAVVYEPSLVWTHLARAGLIEGQYLYLSGTSPVLGTHVPRSKVSSAAGWHACNTTAFTYTGSAANLLVLGAPGHAASTCAMGNSPGLRADEAWGIDTKMDDGRATTGRMTASNSYDVSLGCLPNGFTGELPGTDYVLNSTARACRLMINLDR
ncbi:MAG: hypothetical protein DI582_05435 [Azospirillum brasilense]|nr:MAG: hypothetical protein DI582_05435 [Azospirillum brasilense]